MAKKKRKGDDDEDDKPKKKKKPAKAAVVDDDDDDIDNDAEAISRAKKTGENAYTGLLAITTIGLVAAAVMLYLDTSELSEKPISPPTITLPGLGSPTTATAAP